MDLFLNPTQANVDQLKLYVKDLPNKSPFVWLVKYEQQLVDTNKNVRALVRVCNSDQHSQISKLENLTKENWFRVSNMTDINLIPNNYFDIVLWSDCDLESELRKVLEIYPKLKPGGRIYFNNLISSFSGVLRKCLDADDLKKFIGKNLSKTVEDSDEFAQLVKSILGAIFKATNQDYNIAITQYGGTIYIVLVKGTLKFGPSKLLTESLEKVDDTVANKFPLQKTLTFTVKKIEQIRNKVFDIVVKAVQNGAGVDSEELCNELLAKNLLPDCKTIGPHSHFLTKEHTKAIEDSLELVTSQIDSNISVMGTTNVDEIVNNVIDIIDPNVATEERWKKYIKELAEEKVQPILEEQEATESVVSDVPSFFGEDEGKEIDDFFEDDDDDDDGDDDDGDDDEDDDDEDDEDDEDQEYPLIPAPDKPLPAILLPGLTNVGGFSCFMDSILFTIFLPQNGYFQKRILDKNLTIQNVKACGLFEENPKQGLDYLQNFQGQLSRLANIIRGNEEPDLTCLPIVQQLKKCSLITQELMSGQQQDDSEFLISLMQTFNITPTTVVKKRAVSDDSNDWTQTSEIQLREAVLEVPIPDDKNVLPELISFYQREEITNYKNAPQKDWPKGPAPDEKRYQYSKEKITILNSNALIFHVPRRITKFVGGKLMYIKNTRAVKFTQYILQKPNVHFELQTVTIHSGGASGGHYTAYFKYAGQWFYYNDISDVRVRVASWEEVVDKGKNNGSLFMYYPID